MNAGVLHLYKNCQRHFGETVEKYKGKGESLWTKQFIYKLIIWESMLKKSISNNVEIDTIKVLIQFESFVILLNKGFNSFMMKLWL